MKVVVVVEKAQNRLEGWPRPAACWRHTHNWSLTQLVAAVGGVTPDCCCQCCTWWRKKQVAGGGGTPAVEEGGEKGREEKRRGKGEVVS